MWTYQGQEQTEAPAGMIGFVYLITNRVDGRKYVGKKLYQSAKSKVVAGKKKKFKVESDWQKYFGSNEELILDVKTIGKDNFTREILYQCESLGVLSYLETREQFDRRVLESNEYYNKWSMIRIRQDHLGKLKP
jgi:hypothetical protein